jgi:hypothetical protein
MALKLRELRRDVELLRRQFLPDPFDLLGVYPNQERVHANTRAFLVLSHAELESYLEEWARELARASERIWLTSVRVTMPLAFLLSWSTERLGIPEKLGTPAGAIGRQKLAQIVTKLFQSYYKRVNDNNGVKEKNVLALFAPLGLAPSAFTAALMPNLDELGSIRGTYAHGARKAVTSVLDPETEYKRVMVVLKDLEVFETAAVAYRRGIR